MQGKQENSAIQANDSAGVFSHALFHRLPTSSLGTYVNVSKERCCGNHVKYDRDSYFLNFSEKLSVLQKNTHL